MHFKERYKVYSVCTWIIYILLVGLSPHIVLTYTDGIRNVFKSTFNIYNL